MTDIHGLSFGKNDDEKIEIYINVKDVDVSDMEQVYNALGAELNHYNPSNPYVYDKTEEQAGKGNVQEELFTSIGRKPLDGSGNNFYENILNGSSTLESGNREYSSIDEGKLDFCTSNAQTCRQDYKPIGTSKGTIGAGLFIEQAQSMTLILQMSKFDPNAALKLEGQLIDGKLPEYDYNTGLTELNNSINKEAEKLRQGAIKELDVTNYESPYAMGTGIIISPDNIKVNIDYKLKA